MKYKNQIYHSDDYAGCENGKYNFYFGYEETFCKLHGKNSDCDCDNKEDCFVVKVNGKEALRLTRKELDETVGYASPNLFEPTQYLLAGILEYFNEINKKVNK